MMRTAAQMLGGGLAMSLVSVATGEHVDGDAFSRARGWRSPT